MVKIALAQIDLTVGDIDGNSARIVDAIEQASEQGAQIVALPELAVTGYPPEDLVAKRSFVRANKLAIEDIARATSAISSVIGFVDQQDDALFNAAAICVEGQVAAVYHKHLLPNYGVFDERRYFEPGREHLLVDTPSGVLGVCVCEDIWFEDGPAIAEGDAGAQVVININASPFHKNKLAERTEMLARRARRAKASIAYVNMVGAQDELVFDGGSLVLDPSGEVVARLPQFKEQIATVEVPLGTAANASKSNTRRITAELRSVDRRATPAMLAPPLVPEEEIYRALTLGLADYASKNRFEKVVVGLSGGIDSSLTATIATDALGNDAVLGVIMPSEYSTSHSVQDAKALASNLDIHLIEIPIGEIFQAYVEALRNAFGRADQGIAEENLQARIRGNLLMATSNRYGHLVLATGNKSEMACGYSTLYGDMAGGFALLKDVFKTEVYALARFRNTVSAVIPDNVIAKPPSAELRPDQKDSDSLPPYEELDPILEAYIEGDASVPDIIAAGHDPDTVRRVITLVDRAEYKRRQAPPGPKVTTKAFGRDRRLPITNRWHEDRADLPARSVGDNRPE
jgi:NAD+ synthase (glutamine-hydrolysing)